MTRAHTVVVIAKDPVPGRVKTRLHTGYLPEEAAALAEAALADTLDAVAASRPRRALLALDGDDARWSKWPVTVVPQVTGGLDQRLEGAFAAAFAVHPRGPVLLVGMDTPQVTAKLLRVPWGRADAVLGLSEDGGYWAVGLRRNTPGAFRGVPMSTAHTGLAQLARLREAGLRVKLLPRLRDVDTPADAAAVAALAPRTRFARLHDELLARRGDEEDRIPGPRVERGRRLQPVDLFEAGLRGEQIQARTAGGDVIGLDVTRWRADADEADRLLLSRCEPPVLDLGCGPGRLVAAVAETGSPALGVDVSGLAVTLAAARGASVLRRALELPLPGHGRWGTVLLADGNIGIGGDPLSLLTRCFGLLRPGGLLLVESDPDDAVDTRERLVLHGARGRRSLPLPWARQGAPALTRAAESAGFVVSEEWRTAGRVFLALRRPAPQF